MYLTSATAVAVAYLCAHRFLRCLTWLMSPTRWKSMVSPSPTTLGHVAQIAQIALIHDLHVVGLGDTIDFHRVGLVNQVKQRGERRTQGHATATAVADVKYTFQFLIEGLFVIEVVA